MNKCTKISLVVPMLVPALELVVAGQLAAQTFTTLHSFTATSTNSPGVYTNSDGSRPLGELVQSSNTLYGTTAADGEAGNGTVFTVSVEGTGFAVLHSFTSMNPVTNSDGAAPWTGLLLSDNTLYGTTVIGGAGSSGTLFRINTNGTGFTNLHSFATLAPFPTAPVEVLTNIDGAEPAGSLVCCSNILYGTTLSGGTSGNGTVFAVNTDGTGFKTLHTFTPNQGAPSTPPYTNSDGANPSGGLALSGGILFGTARGCGISGQGTVFALKTDGTGFTNLHDFTALEAYNTNGDGAFPNGLILSGNTLYGTAHNGGSFGQGTVFKLGTEGAGFTILHAFSTADVTNSGPNSDGALPWGGLLMSDNILYGTASYGGHWGNGTAFALKSDGTAFTVLHHFTAAPASLSNSDGAHPLTGLNLSSSTLYGTALVGGSSGNGTVFSILLSTPQLTIIPLGQNVFLSWPTNSTGFTLQSTANLGSSAVWTTNSTAPVVVNGQYTVTNPIAGAQQFFRLSQ